MTVQTGIGYDCHPFADGRRLVLGGVELSAQRGLAGHSDADVLTHAIIDALLGAAGLPDIGHQFPTPTIATATPTRSSCCARLWFSSPSADCLWSTSMRP